jgi:hypothetical protein
VNSFKLFGMHTLFSDELSLALSTRLFVISGRKKSVGNFLLEGVRSRDLRDSFVIDSSLSVLKLVALLSSIDKM